MSESGSEHDPVTQLAEEYLERYRRGERPSVTEFVRRRPDLEAEIRDLFPALLLMEEVRPEIPASAAAAPGPGRGPLTRLGDFRIVREIGRGGMGIVYEAEQESLGRRVALKVLSPAALRDPKQVERFRREARAAARLHHTNIVPVFGVGEEGGTHYYVMQYIEGQPLDQVLLQLARLRDERTGELRPDPLADRVAAADVAESLWASRAGAPAEPAPEKAPAPRPGNASPDTSASSHLLPDARRRYAQNVAHVGAQVADALDYAAKQGVLHRDIKPANLLLDVWGTVWVTDFGLAKATGQDDITHTGDIIGTLRYMAPERFDGRADIRSDVYALGLTLYELLAFKPAFEAPDRPRLIHQVMNVPPRPLSEAAPSVPNDLVTIVHKATAADPADRYPSAEALAEDLRCFLNDRPIVARRATWPERAWRWCRRNPAVAALAAAFATALLVGSGGAAYFAVQAHHRAGEAMREMARAEGLAEQMRQAKRASDLGRYISDMRLAQQAVESGYFLLAREMLNRHLPDPDQEDLRGFEWRCLHRLSRDRSRATLRGHSAAVLAAVPSPDGKWLATSGWDRTLRLWDLASGRPTLVVHGPVVLALAFAPGGKTLAVAREDFALSLWDLDSRRERVTLPHPAAVRSVAYAPDGKTLATGADDGRIRRWDLASGRETAALSSRARQVTRLALSPDGRVLAYAADDATVRLCDAATWAESGELRGHATTVTSLAFAPDGRTLATGCNDTTVKLWDVAARRERKTIRAHRAPVLGLAFDADGRTLATACSDSTVKLWDPDTGDGRGLLGGHTAGLTAVAFLPGGSGVVSASDDGTVKLWDLAPGAAGEALAGHDGWARAVAYLADGKRILTGDQKVRLWDAAPRAPLGVLEGFDSPTSALAVSPDGAWAAAASYAEKSITLWDLGTRRVAARLTGHDWPVTSLAFSPDGATLASGSWDNTVRLWDLAGKRERAALRGATEGVVAVAFSPDGRRLAAGGHDAVLRVWDLATAELVANLSGHTKPVTGVAFAPDGNLLASVSRDGTLRFWDPAAGRAAATLRGHTSHVVGVTFSPDGRVAATASWDGSVKLWHVGMRQEMTSLSGHAGPVTGVAFAPDGKTLATSGADGTARLWEAPPLADLDAADAPPPEPAPTPGPEFLHRPTLVLQGKARATFRIEEGAYRLDVTDTGDEKWHAHVQMTYDNLQEGAAYVFRFRARTDKPQRVSVYGQIDRPDWHGIGLDKRFNLAEPWESFEFPFTATGVTERTKVGLFLGQQPGTVWLADVALTRAAP